jgi:hypothetical protein
LVLIAIIIVCIPFLVEGAAKLRSQAVHHIGAGSRSARMRWLIVVQTRLRLLIASVGALVVRTKIKALLLLSRWTRTIRVLRWSLCVPASAVVVPSVSVSSIRSLRRSLVAGLLTLVLRIVLIALTVLLLSLGWRRGRSILSKERLLLILVALRLMRTSVRLILLLILTACIVHMLLLLLLLMRLLIGVCGISPLISATLVIHEMIVYLRGHVPSFWHWIHRAPSSVPRSIHVSASPRLLREISFEVPMFMLSWTQFVALPVRDSHVGNTTTAAIQSRTTYPFIFGRQNGRC